MGRDVEPIKNEEQLEEEPEDDDADFLRLRYVLNGTGE